MSIQLLKEYMENTGLSQAKAGAQLGYSPAVVSTYLKGLYKGDVAAIDKAVVELADRYRSKQKDVAADFVQTPTASRILEICGLAHDMSDIYLVIGEAGLGKTMALKEYAARKSNVTLMEVDPTFTAKVMLQELCTLLGITAARNSHAMMTAIIDKLKGSDRLLIVDEAELLSYKPLEILRRIHDKTGCAIVLAGMPKLRANLRGARGEYKQLFSRIGLALDIKTRLPAADIYMFCEAALGTDAFNERLYEVSKGNARRLNKLLRGVRRIAVINNVEVNEAIIERFAEMLID